MWIFDNAEVGALTPELFKGQMYMWEAIYLHQLFIPLSHKIRYHILYIKNIKYAISVL